MIQIEEKVGHSYSTAEDENGERFCETCRVSHNADELDNKLNERL